MLGQSNIIVRIPPTVGDRSLVDYPILITPPRYGAILDLALLAVAVRGWLSRPTLRFLQQFPIVFGNLGPHVREATVADFHC